MLVAYNQYLTFNTNSIENMPSWVKQEKYYNCDDFMNMFALSRRQKKDKNSKKS